MFTVEIKKDDETLGIKKGEQYLAVRYPYDDEKITLVSRVPDGFDPECNQYWADVKIIPKKRKTN
ncbi:hypothetical protein [uncultured Gilliamella sp.]|uniref:hypothetical protein n=1 Tax=uncultured Gilliamella sp. TaxID=1193505 RepID=UPI0025F48A91|nr:hypothetical protein [uncultured Gilliamella sp.]